MGCVCMYLQLQSTSDYRCRHKPYNKDIKMNKLNPTEPQALWHTSLPQARPQLLGPALHRLLKLGLKLLNLLLSEGVGIGAIVHYQAWASFVTVRPVGPRATTLGIPWTLNVRDTEDFLGSPNGRASHGIPEKKTSKEAWSWSMEIKIPSKVSSLEMISL
ncbi:hypothetical protein CRG98_016862 [Punica granatum]|uniref:Uncharacterized protein n=1 Tax=Punica granatum TaxID=22663 RepID=A0A2I0K3R6_PUNGR|nr:hypothetical protein CRG98_016862 [Punica granatum]